MNSNFNYTFKYTECFMMPGIAKLRPVSILWPETGFKPLHHFINNLAFKVHDKVL